MSFQYHSTPKNNVLLFVALLFFFIASLFFAYFPDGVFPSLLSSFFLVIFIILFLTGGFIYGFLSKSRRLSIVFGFFIPVLAYLIPIIIHWFFYSSFEFFGSEAAYYLIAAIIGGTIGWCASVNEEKKELRGYYYLACLIMILFLFVIFTKF
ncbi:hypothetical protein MsAg5_12700 [Methanosarcinaceae archaeon Ag5]|uniref:Uncharacterized protein n=1 Tax=Methanolapillus africanus TaxID=3028297 RepID=A0AAE4SE98_9EURY|nr:hypothetical protein [Methanosarcinaceae archaeon Ag5]